MTFQIQIQFPLPPLSDLGYDDDAAALLVRVDS